MDTRPGFDDTGLLVGLLLLAAAVAVAVDGSGSLGHAVLLGVLVGGPTPAWEVANGGQAASVVALVITLTAALVAASVLRTVTTSGSTGTS